MIYGNIGVPERIEFSVIGPAANEAWRLEGLTAAASRMRRLGWAGKPATD